MSKSTIYRLEKGDNVPTLGVLEILSSFYGDDLIDSFNKIKNTTSLTMISIIVSFHKGNDSLKRNLFHNISIMYDRFDNIKESYKYLDLEHKLVQESLDYKNSPFIVYTKGVLDLKTNNSDYLNKFSLAIKLCDLYDNQILKTNIFRKLSLFNIKLQEQPD